MPNESTEIPATLARQIPTVGAHPNISFEEYAKWEAVNWHTLKPFDVSSKQGRFEMLLPPPASEDMVFGGAFHCALLEPEQFPLIYRVMPRFEGHPNSNAFKAKRAEWEAANADAVKITADEMDAITGMQKAVFDHPTARAILRAKGKNELSIAWHDKESGTLCKGRVDRLCRIPAAIIDPTASGDLIVLVDLKKTAFIHKFDTEVAKYGYHGQLAFYADGIAALSPGRITPLIIAVEDKPPFDVAIFSTADAVDQGRKLYRRLMKTLERGKKSNHWPGICPHGTIPIILPKWACESEDQL